MARRMVNIRQFLVSRRGIALSEEFQSHFNQPQNKARFSAQLLFPLFSSP
jgi:hypothetical protein